MSAHQFTTRGKANAFVKSKRKTHHIAGPTEISIPAYIVTIRKKPVRRVSKKNK